MVVKKNLKDDVVKELKKAGVNTSRLRFRYHKQSPYQKRRYKPEYIEQELWIYRKGGDGYYMIMSNSWFNNPSWRKHQINEIKAEQEMGEI